jgi:proton glutamate symport protein
MSAVPKPRGLVLLVAVCVIAGAATAAGALHYHFAGTLAAGGATLVVARWVAIGVLLSWALARKSLTGAIFVSMLAGALLGRDWPEAAVHIAVLRDVFLRLIKTIIAPLIFSTLVVGIAGHSDLKKVGRMGLKALIYFEVVTTLALIIGLVAINLSKAGVGVHATATTESAQAVAHPSASDLILHAVPENIAKAVVEGQVLQVVVFSVIFAIALALLTEEKRRPMLAFCGSLSETMFKFTNIVMWFAPFGVLAAIAVTVAQTGFSVLSNLAMLLATLYAALLAFLLLVLLPVALIARVPLGKFLRAVSEPATIAFATANSEAALPRAMEAMEAIGVPRETVAFVIPTGYSFNLDGSTLYQAMAAIFVAQAGGVTLTIGQQVALMLTIMLASKGTAGVSRASLVILMGVAAQFKLPLEPIFLIMGIDQLMDMGRTSINVIGNCLATVVIARWEGEFGSEPPSPVVADALR